MASFIEKLRMNNIFGGGGILPQLDIPSYSSGDPMEEVLSRYSSMIPQTSGIQDIGGRISDGQEQMRTRVLPPPPGITPFQEASLALRERGLAGQEERAEESTRLREEQLNINKKRAEIYDFTSKNPNARIIQRDGNLIAINPRTGEDIKDLGSSRFLSDEDRLELQQSGRMELEGVRQEGRKELEGIRQTGREGIEDIRARHRKELSEFQSELPPRTSGLASQQARQFQNRYNVLINKKPEYRDFVELSPDGMPIIEEPGTNIFGRPTGPTKEQYDEIYRSIFGTTSTKETTTMTPEIEIKPEEEMIRVEGPIDPKTGKKMIGRVPKNETLPKGWKAIGK